MMRGQDMNGSHLYELALIREQEYMNEATLRRAERRDRWQGRLASARRHLRRSGRSGS